MPNYYNEMFEKSKRSLAAATRSGTYRVQPDSFQTSSTQNLNGSSAKNRRLSQVKNLCVTVVFLDGSQHSFEIEKNAKGSVLLDRVFLHLELIERDYFGLQFDELLPPPECIHPLSSPHLRWVESSKPVRKQIRFTKPSKKPNNDEDVEMPRNLSSATVYFRVKFFVEDPARLNEEYTRYHFFLQIRKDVTEGRLPITPSTTCLLASYAVQSELGDYNSDEHDESGFYLKNLLTLNLDSNLNKTAEYLKKTAQLHKLHKGQTPADAEFNYLDHAKRIDYYGLDFHRVKESGGKEIEVGVSSNGVGVYHNGIKINSFSWSKITKIAFKRKHFFIQLRREASEDYDTLLLFDCWSYRSCKRLWKSCVEHHAFFRLSAPPRSSRRPALFLLTLGSRFRYSGRTEYQTREDAAAASRSQSRERSRTFFRSPSKKLLCIRQTINKESEGNDEKENREDEGENSHKSTNRNPSANLIQPSIKERTLRASDKVQSYTEKEPRRAWTELSSGHDNDNGGFLNRTEIQATTHSLHNTRNGIAFADEDNGDHSQSDDGTVSIRLEPDRHGKFGFNVKGGSDMGCPVLVSRVAPGTPADQCYPRVNEGDHLIQVNGKDTVNMPHREVVNSIRHAATVKKELLLRVRQNVYTTEDYEEPPFQYVPDVPSLLPHHQLSGEHHVQSQLASSMLLLGEAIESDSISNQFELVFRRKVGLTYDISKLSENMSKNRYRDILPYDKTRVILQNSPTGDYINANYVTMEIPVSGVVNRYIACQGPLSSTCADFWIMVWETQSPLIVMLTPICERGRIKCHPYWPTHLNSSVIYHNIKVATMEEKILPHWIQREFHLEHMETHEERVVVQLQFQSWPDHGVPDDPVSFIRFMEQVRRARLGTVDPTIIHCSAGIGRTGVLILMETAECLIEANQPVYPLDIVSQMRLQRPLMIQTPSQYRFVCNSVLRVYQQGIIRPLPEFGTSPTQKSIGVNPILAWIRK